MLDLSLTEAQLFRLLVSFFGREHVIPHMSVLAVCGGSLPTSITESEEFAKLGGNRDFSIEKWASANRCLFTIVNREDLPKMVIEFFSGFEKYINAIEAEHQRYLPTVLMAAGVRYVTISEEEFSEMLDPKSSIDLRVFLESKLSASDSLQC